MSRGEKLRISEAEKTTLQRRAFLKASAHGFGAAALGSLLAGEALGADSILDKPHHQPKAKRVIYLFQSGGPSQLDLFDPKPGLEKLAGKQLPDSIRGSQRITTMTSGQKTLPVLPSQYPFRPHGESG
ncbi:MAG: DUF1501 domain-containing protein, partial [Planctomycetota bacterium]|nr:DUF1501 domain-containing protein [Planctomycetota bacterium]